MEGDALVFHFANPTAGEIAVTFRAGRRSLRLPAVRQDEYNVAVRFPRDGAWSLADRRPEDSDERGISAADDGRRA